MTHPRTLATSVLVALLLFAGPAALAGPGDDKARGRCAKGEDHPGNGNGPKCEPEDETSSAPAEEDPSTEGSSNEGSPNEHPDEGPPGRSNNSSGSRPAAQPSPTPSGTPPAAGDVIVTVSVSRSIAQVGTTLTYTVTVQNPGSTTVSPTVTNAIPDEVLFMSATAQPAPTFSSGSLTWVPTLEPGGSLALTWQGRVADEGDLDATNVVTAPGASPIETHTYLATVKGLVLNRSTEEPDWGTHEERKVVFTTEERAADGALSDDEVQASSGVLPYTGAPLVPLVVLAALLVLGGCMLMTQRGRRLSAVGLLVVLVAAACTSEPPPRDQATETEGGEGDEVLGTRVGRGDDETTGGSQDDGAGATDENDSNENGADGTPEDETAGDDEAADVTDPTTTPDDPAPAEEPETVTTREVVIVEVPNDPPAPSALRASGGDNRIVLDWDAATRSIVSAFSTAIFRADSPIQFLTSLEEGRDGIVSRISMTNVTGDERLLVSGTLVLKVSGPAGTFELSSPQLQEILDPADEVSATFEFALPSGDYQIEAAYLTG